MVKIFKKDDEGYFHWPNGFVLNDFKIHETECNTLKRLTRGARTDNPFTTVYPKACAETTTELFSWEGAPSKTRLCGCRRRT